MGIKRVHESDRKTRSTCGSKAKADGKHAERVVVGKGVGMLNMKLGSQDSREMLARLVAPLAVDRFLEQYWKKQAVAFLGGGPSRVRGLVSALHGLDVQDLLADTPSESIKAWVKPLDEAAQVESLEVDEKQALALSRAGASLYFRAPQEFTDTLLPRLAKSLGMDFSIYYADGALRGETETFIARRSHRTDWHTDFQENFTIQLLGSRRWFFKRQPGPGAPLRGLSQHYSTLEVYEDQMKVARDANEAVEYSPAADFFADAEEVVLHAGDVLYHPAGIWHAVECDSELAISINFSLSNLSWADVLGSAVQQRLWQEEPLRERISGVSSAAELRTQLAAKLQQLQKVVASLSIDDLCPPALALPRVTTIVVRGRPEFRPAKVYRRSRLSVLIPAPPGESAGSYVLHSNFGNSDLESILRVELRVPVALIPAVEHLRHHREVHSAALPGPAGLDLQKGLLRALWFAGYLVAKRPVQSRGGRNVAAKNAPARTRHRKLVKKRPSAKR